MRYPDSKVSEIIFNRLFQKMWKFIFLPKRKLSGIKKVKRIERCVCVCVCVCVWERERDLFSEKKNVPMKFGLKKWTVTCTLSFLLLRQVLIDFTITSNEESNKKLNSLFIEKYIYIYVSLNNKDKFCLYNLFKILSSFLISVLVSSWNW